jgi:catechol 2,3-dioxygenase-like lactoylglutathione lyase family enzyme
MANEVVVPVLPTRSLKTTLEFYNALGFHTTHEQHAPYVYGAVQHEDINLHFHGSDTLEPNRESSHICLVMVRDVNALHQTFTSGVKQHFGKRLRTGIPRIGNVNTLSKDRRFNLLDPDGNRLIVIQTLPSSAKKPKPARTTPLARAVTAARLDAYSRDAPRIAAQFFDEALEHTDNEPNIVLFRAYVLRADIAVMLEDRETLQRFVSSAKRILLEDAERLELREELERLGELETMLEARDS